MRSPPDLAVLQSEFRDAVFQPASADALLTRVLETADVARRRLAAYRASVHGVLLSALEAGYPVLLQVVGLEFFRATARRYLGQHPSRSGDLNSYGADFAEFLATDPPCAQLPYLPDLARLEWLVQQVYGAADVQADLSALAATPPESYGELRFALVPAHARLDSRWPLVRIWQLHQAEVSADELAVDFSQGDHVLVFRRLGQVQVECLTPAEAAFIDALVEGSSLAEATACASHIAADFDPGPALARLGKAELLTALPAKGEDRE